jgi:hypothetical protein
MNIKTKGLLGRQRYVALLFRLEIGEDFGGVAFGSDGRPESFDLSGFADEEGAADDAHEFAAHELLLLPRAKFSDAFVIGIAEQREIQLELGFERGLGVDGISAHAEDGYA